MTISSQKVLELKQSVCQDIDARANDLVSISHQLHAKPETNFEEHFAHQILTDYIADSKVKVTRKAFDLDTAFDVRIKGGSGPTVAVLCEYDALPGIGHACGHNIIATAGLGAGLALSAIAEQCGGNLVFLWVRQPKKAAAGKLKWRERVRSRESMRR
jgi:metal-dependent amidase/aminoacylase/carboxypeptidase family protein